ARNPVDKLTMLSLLARLSLKLEAGNPRVEVHANRLLLGFDFAQALPEDMTLHVIVPHMHQVGREMQVWATLPDGKRIDLIWLKDWDFNWQESYRYKTPIRLPKGTRIE